MDSTESCDDFDRILKDGFQSMLDGARAANALPIEEERAAYIRSHPEYDKEIIPQNDRLLNSISSMLESQNIRGNIRRRDMEDKIDLVIDGMEVLSDKIGHILDNMNGLGRNKAVQFDPKPGRVSLPSASWNKNAVSPMRNAPVKTNIRSYSIFSTKCSTKPDLKNVDNTKSLFKPFLTRKPNASKPLSIFLETKKGIESYCHPYQFELDNFSVPPLQLIKTEPIFPDPGIPFSYVDQKDELIAAMEELKAESIVAVDLEHHNMRSYHGFTCLIQISTRSKDYIIDAIALREDLGILNDVFTDPNVVKIFHDASSDSVWLQKDFSVYLVNLFDTFIAASALHLERKSLASLLDLYCRFYIPKKEKSCFQQFDWRHRPLPMEALEYARNDTHFLPYIYETMRNAVLDAGGEDLLQNVYKRGVAVCSKKYTKAVTSVNTFYKNSKKKFHNQQMTALESLYNWRDETAREKDESPGFILPNHQLTNLAEWLPKEVAGIFSLCNPLPLLVRENMSHLHKMIAHARKQPREFPPPDKEEEEDDEMECVERTEGGVGGRVECVAHFAKNKAWSDEHDDTYGSDFSSDLPTLLNGKCSLEDILSEGRKGMKEASVSVFNVRSHSCGIVLPRHMNYLSPYERYKMTMEFLAAKDENNKKDEGNEKAANVKVKEEPGVHEYTNATERKRKKPDSDVILLSFSSSSSSSSAKVKIPDTLEAANDEDVGGNVKQKLDKLRQLASSIAHPVVGGGGRRNRRKNNKRHVAGGNNNNTKQKVTIEQGEGSNDEAAQPEAAPAWRGPSTARASASFQPYDYTGVDFTQRFKGSGKGMAGGKKQPNILASNVSFRKNKKAWGKARPTKKAG